MKIIKETKFLNTSQDLRAGIEEFLEMLKADLDLIEGGAKHLPISRMLLNYIGDLTDLLEDNPSNFGGDTGIDADF